MKLHGPLRIDLPRKLMAFTCAFLIWYSVHKQLSEEEVYRDIPITLKHNKSITVGEQELPKVNVTVKGSKKRLKNMTNADIKVFGQISEEATNGRYTVQLRDKNIELPGHMEVVDIQPNSFHVYIDQVETKDSVPIRCRFDGQLPEDYGRKNLIIVPKIVQITGPSKTIRGIRDITTEPIKLDKSIMQDFEIEIALEKLPQVTITPEKVKVTVELYKMRDSKLFSDLDIAIMNSSNKDFYVAEILSGGSLKAEAVVNGPKGVMDALSNSSLRPFIDISKISTIGTCRLPVHLWVDANDCVPLEITPLTLEVRIGLQTK